MPRIARARKAARLRPCRDRSPLDVLIQWADVNASLYQFANGTDTPAGAGALLERCAIVSTLTGLPVADLIMCALGEDGPIAADSLAADLLARVHEMQELHGFFGVVGRGASFAKSRPKLLAGFRNGFGVGEVATH